MTSADLRRLLTFLLPATFLGLIIKELFLALVLALSAYIFFFHLKLNRTLKWIKNRREDFPTNLGVIPDALDNVILAVSELRKRQRSRKKQLRTILKEFRQATKALPDAVVSLDNENTVRWANKTAIRLLGIKIPDDVGRRIINVVREPLLKEVLEADDKKTNMIRIKAPREPSKIMNLVSAQYGKNQRLLVGRDITAIEEALEARSDFVANVSHELRTPLTVFKGYIENLIRLKEEEPTGKWHKPIEEMAKQANRMSKLVEELLLLSKLESEEPKRSPESISVSEIINQIHRRATSLKNTGSQLFSLETDDTLKIEGSEEELYIVFSNIIFNAVRYTSPDSGVIQIKWQRTTDGLAKFEVKDNGIGIAQEHLPRVTERFYRVDESRQRISGDEFSSTGLGLALVKHIVERHSGKLEMESELGSGSTFRVIFSKEMISSRPTLSDKSSI